MSSRSEASYNRYLEAKKLVAEGMTIKNAAKRVRIANATWYTQQTREQKGVKVRKPYTFKNKKHKFVDLSPVGTPGPARVAVIVCDATQLQTVLKELQ